MESGKAMKTISLTFSDINGIMVATLRVDDQCVVPKEDSLPIDLTAEERDLCISFIRLGCEKTKLAEIKLDNQKLRELVDKYPEWNDDLDVTACPTGFVTCPICDCGGYIRERKSFPGKKTRERYPAPVHAENCPRGKFEQQKQS